MIGQKEERKNCICVQNRSYDSGALYRHTIDNNVALSK